MVAPHARQVANLANARSLGLRWRSYVGLLSCALVVVVALLVLPAFRYTQFCLGFVVGGTITLVTVSLARFDDPLVRGHLSEQWTLEALGKIKGWLVTENVPFDRVDVDHVAVTPTAVLAVETKYHGRIQPGSRAEAARLESDLRDARRAAAKIRSLTRSKKLHDLAAVEPLLVIWGAGAPNLPEGYRLIGDVHVVDGHYPELWSHRFSAPLLSPDLRAQVHAAFAEFLQKRQTHEAANQVSLRHRMWHELCSAIAEERSSRSARLDYTRTLRRRHRRGASDPSELPIVEPTTTS
jgi:hypothetical protein